jgi:DNA-binding CsgD family transcriptional regulator
MRLGGEDMAGHHAGQGEGATANKEVWDVVRDLDLSMAIVNAQNYLVESATEAFLEAVERDAADVIDHPIYELFYQSEESSVRAALDALSQGKIEFYRTHRMLYKSDGETHVVSVWVHVLDFGAQRCALCQLVADKDAAESPLMKFLGDPALPLAFGMTDERGTVTSVSDDVHDVLGLEPSDLIGKPLIRGPEASHAWRLLDVKPNEMGKNCISMRVDSFGSKKLAHIRCILTSFVKTSNYGFVLIPEMETSNPPSNDRATQLERSLWKIASEVQASGIFDHLWSFPDAERFPQLNTLSSRQWEVLSLLLRGQRVPSIAETLYISESTVRNSLSAIFHKFGVHSQAELLKLLKGDGPT